MSRREETTIFRLVYRLIETKIQSQTDGTIEINGMNHFNGKPKRWREVEPFVYQEVNGQERIFFVQRKPGVFELAIPFPFMSFERVTFLNDSRFLQILRHNACC